MKANIEIKEKGNCLQALEEGGSLIPEDAFEANVDVKQVGKTNYYDVTASFVNPDFKNLDNQKESTHE